MEETLSLNSSSGHLRLSQERCTKLLPHTLYPDDRHSPWQGVWAREANGLLWQIPRGGPHPAPHSSTGASPAPWSQQGSAIFQHWLGFPALMWVCTLCKIDLWPAIYSFYHILKLRSWPTPGNKSCAFCRGSYFCVCSAKAGQQPYAVLWLSI